jgi:hypothetical protein
MTPSTTTVATTAPTTQTQTGRPFLPSLAAGVGGEAEAARGAAVGGGAAAGRGAALVKPATASTKRRQLG